MLLKLCYKIIKDGIMKIIEKMIESSIVSGGFINWIFSKSFSIESKIEEITQYEYI